LSLTNPILGDLFSIKINFENDERERLKYLVILNTPKPEGLLVFAFTTSKGASRYKGETSAQCGCPKPPCYRIDPPQVLFFVEKTWVQFDNVKAVKSDLVQEFLKQSEARHIAEMPDDRIRSIVNCARKSVDIEKRYLEPIDLSMKERNSNSAQLNVKSKTLRGA
jgi:hypothetical protein